MIQGPGSMAYQDFIIPQLSQVLSPLFNTRTDISIAEIGPGAQSVLGYLPSSLRQKVKRYTAFEPNDLSATSLKRWIYSTSDMESPMPSLESPPIIHRMPFNLHDNPDSTAPSNRGNDEKFDVVLFCHSMYGMKPKAKFIAQALEMLVEQPEGGMVVVFHPDEPLHLDGLVCHRIVSFPNGTVSVEDRDELLHHFASYVAGFGIQDVQVNKTTVTEWQNICRKLGRRDEAHSDHLFFSSLEIMVAFTKHATALPELMAQVPFLKGDKDIKNREALHTVPRLL